jgi:hypothetical protein
VAWLGAFCQGERTCFPHPGYKSAFSLFSKKEGPRHPGSGPVLVVQHGKTYAISGMFLTDRSAGICFFSHTFALHRPTNGAAAIIPNEIPNAICIQPSPFSPGFATSLRVEPAVNVQNIACCYS